ncbi:conserved hypothetical protein [Xenorhabdus nematophila F1]|nr:conserved hypothetical protein [Xenorhabdus nematophila F1]CEE93204.1 hypothetical protein XNA1_350028 [Xenorhabdus nematophila str. Anatoliense]CEF29357.1 hypothetical protein XNW1_1700024 [Xenorhabdus nematophila str. Websteri]CEK21881.1 hypothetical protein XNC2_0885 [Xenorhabdus nematophila AN6/1]CEE93789.1 hypothetical protein XNA1_4310028 [Xenorhabdus nematophila str. Anatoliense]
MYKWQRYTYILALIVNPINQLTIGNNFSFIHSHTYPDLFLPVYDNQGY